MTKRDRRPRRTVTLAPNDEALGPVMAAPHQQPIPLDTRPAEVQAAALDPDGSGFRIVHHPAAHVEVSGWAWAEPPDGDSPTRLGLWALGCGHCGTTTCDHVRAAVSTLEEVLQAAPSPETWRVGGEGIPAQLAGRARRAAERHRQRRRPPPAVGDTFDRAVDSIGTLPDDTPLPYLRENATGGLAGPEGRPFHVAMYLELDVPVPASTAETAALRGRIRRDLADASIGGQTGWTAAVFPNARGRMSCFFGTGFRRDSRSTWHNLEAQLAVLRRYGATTTRNNPYMSVQIDRDTTSYDIDEFNRLFHATAHYEDLLARLGSDPTADALPAQPYDRRALPHRPNGYRSLHRIDLSDTAPLHAVVPNYPDETDPDTTNLLFNSARATLDPARIQANVAAFLGLVDDAETSTGRPGRTTPVGTHHTDGGGGADPHHQAREFARRVSRTPEQVAQLAALYANTDWQTRPDDEA